MKRSSLLGLVVLMGAAPGAARGDQIRWGYDWVAFPGEVPVGESKVIFSDEPYRTASGSSRVVAANLTGASTANPAAPDAFGAGGGYYALAVGLHDFASGQWGALVFPGQLQGRMSQSNSELTNLFTGPTTQTLQLGETLFTVTLDSFAPPGAAGSANQGAIGAYVEVSGLVTTAGQHMPEPSTLALAGLGLAAGGVAAWRRAARSRRSGPGPVPVSGVE